MTKIEGIPQNDGEVRQFILEILVGLREGSYDPATAAVMIAGIKEVNSSLNQSISVFKSEMKARECGTQFVKTVKLGRQLVGEVSDD
jgi:hypothetical protein